MVGNNGKFYILKDYKIATSKDKELTHVRAWVGSFFFVRKNKYIAPV